LIITAPKPKELLGRGLLAPSMIAHILVQKFRFGILFYRGRGLAGGTREPWKRCADPSTACPFTPIW